jgi:nitrogen-specific signal transduction histidine kinase
LTDRAPGAGLGLAIVRQTIDAHDGSIRLDSRPGEGTTFDIRLPIAPAPAATDARDTAAPAPLALPVGTHAHAGGWAKS